MFVCTVTRKKTASTAGMIVEHATAETADVLLVLARITATARKTAQSAETTNAQEQKETATARKTATAETTDAIQVKTVCHAKKTAGIVTVVDSS